MRKEQLEALGILEKKLLNLSIALHGVRQTERGLSSGLFDTNLILKKIRVDVEAILVAKNHLFTSCAIRKPKRITPLEEEE